MEWKGGSCNCLSANGMRRETVMSKVAKIELTYICLLIVCLSREMRGLLHFGVRSTYVGDCKLAQFCPGLSRRSVGEGGQIGYKIEFFCRLETYGNGGSLTSTYRVVRKYNFKS